MKKIAIMGGTFDPIHYGHLVTAEEAREQFSLDKVVFVPSGVPPHKKRKQISAARHRCRMVELAIASNPHFAISHLEVERAGFSYAADTVDAFIEKYGKDTDLYFITGADAIEAIMSWYRVEELMTKCNFIAASRPGYDFDRDFHIPQIYRQRVLPLQVTALSISSSQIRSMRAKNRSIKYLLPESDEQYIYDHHLYMNKEGDS